MENRPIKKEDLLPEIPKEHALPPYEKRTKLVRKKSLHINLYPEIVNVFIAAEKLRFNKKWREIADELNTLFRFKKYKLNTNAQKVRTVFEKLQRERMDLMYEISKCIEDNNLKSLAEMEIEAMEKEVAEERKRLNKSIIDLDNRIEEKLPDANFRDLTDARKKAFEQRQILENKPTHKIDIITHLGGASGVNKLIDDIRDESNEDNSVEGEVIESTIKEDEPKKEERSTGTITDPTKQ